MQHWKMHLSLIMLTCLDLNVIQDVVLYIFMKKIFLLINSYIQMRACLIRRLYAYSWVIIVHNQNSVINTVSFVFNSITNALFYVLLSLFTPNSYSNLYSLYYSWVWR